VAIGNDKSVSKQLRVVMNVGAIRELTDGQLLERFATDRSEAAELAFAALVERHGPMVLRVCRSILLDTHEAQDAFQATFLILVQKTRSLWVRESLGPWLHEVAFRTASRARTNAARRRRHEREASLAMEKPSAERDPELEHALHGEIERLAQRYRVPVILCDLEGCTHEQAARHLGWPVGTVKSRLSRGRERLRARLVRKGFGPGAGILATSVWSNASGASVPSALMESVTRAAAEFVTTKTIVASSVASLAHGVLTAMTLTRWLKTLSILLVVAVTVPGIGIFVRNGAVGSEPGREVVQDKTSTVDVPVQTVKPGPLRVTVHERGAVETAIGSHVYCGVQGRTTILTIAPEGTYVQKGDLVCELDSAALRDELTNQEIATKRAAADHAQARAAREVAEIAVREYRDGVLPHEIRSLDGAIAKAKSAVQTAESKQERLHRAQARIRATKPAAEANTPAVVMAELDIEDRLEVAEVTVANEKLALELAQSNLEVLRNFTAPRTTKELEGAIERKRSDELAKQAIFDLEQSKERRLIRQINNCKILAPNEGMVVYADAREGQPRIEEGAQVRERQLIFSLPDLRSPMRVNAKVREAWIDQIVPKQRVRIAVHAFADQTFEGTVTTVAPLPDAMNRLRTDQTAPKLYTTLITLDKAFPGLRPGMTTDVEILVAERQNVLSVPVSAVQTRQRKYCVAVKKPDGSFEWREVTVGIGGEDMVEITSGLKEGESVAVKADAVPSRNDRPESAPPTKPATTKDRSEPTEPEKKPSA
jgi:RNA polymerase sigma factor (sigma-70 family)